MTTSSRWWGKWFAPLLACAALFGCASASDGPSSETESAPQAATAEKTLAAGEARRGQVGIGTEYADVYAPIAGVAGDRDVVFVGEPINGAVIVLSRLTGQQIGELSPPPGGFAVPFIIHTIGEGRVTVLGAGGYPQPKPFVPANPTLYEYRYQYSPVTGFTSIRSRDIRFLSVLVGFAENFVLLDDGRYLVSDAILGSLWVVRKDGSIEAGIVPRTWAKEDRIPQMAFCEEAPTTRVNGYPFRFSGSTLPGISPLAVRDGTVYFASTCARGIYSFPLRILRDNRPAYQRARDIRLVVPTAKDVLVEELLDFTFHPYNRADRWLYAADALQLQIVRIDVHSGRRQVVAGDPKLFDFPSSLGFLPPLIPGISPLAVVSNQQERSPLTNAAVTETTIQLPFKVAKVFVGP